MQFRKRAPTELDVNLVPLIDILMSVLIFLAITTSYNKFTELQVQLPVANSEAIREYPKEIILYVSSDGRYAINREILQEHTPEGVARALTQAGITPESTLIISADAASSHQAVITAMEAARQAGMVKITFATRKPESQ